MGNVHMKVYRGNSEGGQLKDYDVQAEEGMVVLDVIHKIQATQSSDLACRWNCKAGKCGSCCAEDQRQAPPDVHDPHERVPRRRDHHRHPHEDLPPDEGPGHRRFL